MDSKNFKDYKLGAKKSPIDERDFKIKDLKASISQVKEVLPEQFILEYKGVTKDQGAVSSCVANSLAYTREITETQQTGIYSQFSVGYIYSNRTPLMDSEEGMIPREAIQCLVDFGDVHYVDFPYDEDYPTVKARIDKDKSRLASLAYPNRISSYYACDNVDDIKYALVHLGAVSVCLQIFPSFFDTPNNNSVASNAQWDKEECLGLHEVTIFGYNSTTKMLIVKNSWGKDWCTDSIFYLPFDTNLIQEAWALTDKILPVPVQPSVYWRVQVEANKLRENSKNTCEKLTKLGVDNCMIYENGYFKVQVGSFTSTKYRDEKVNQLIALEYKPYIITMNK